MGPGGAQAGGARPAVRPTARGPRAHRPAARGLAAEAGGAAGGGGRRCAPAAVAAGSEAAVATAGFISKWLAASVPGANQRWLTEGWPSRVPAGSRLVIQVHYTATGAPQEDQCAIGLVFADPRTVRKEVVTDMVVNPRFDIRLATRITRSRARRAGAG